MDCIRQLRLVPREIRSDRGTENTIICGIQRFLRRNAEDLISNKNSFVYGSSTHNQRIECWWSILRRSRLNWWINFFKDIPAENILDTSLTYVEFLRFCFLGILQEQLDGTRRLWNNHFVRKTRNTECPGGRLDVLLYTPSLVGGKDCRSPFVEADVNLALPYYEAPELFDDIGFCSPYHEWKESCNGKNPTSSKRAFYNSASKRWFCLKRFLVQCCSSLLVWCFHVLHSDTSKIWGIGVCAEGEG